jgi:hypothetical protein
VRDDHDEVRADLAHEADQLRVDAVDPPDVVLREERDAAATAVAGTFTLATM